MMKRYVSIQSPEILTIRDGEDLRYGADQAWFRKPWQQISGCGPTAGANLLYYLSRTRASCRALCEIDASTREGMTRLMEGVWRFVTPGFGGVNRIAILQRGIKAYAAERGVSLDVRGFPIPNSRRARKSIDEMLRFIADALERDVPVAFLNLSSGAIEHLEDWHWVTLIALDVETAAAQVFDQGKRLSVDLSLWLRSAAMGGGLVAAWPDGDAGQTDQP